jgi:transposase-like protein
MTQGSRAANAFDSLPPDQRAAVELVLRQGRSYAELAGLLGIPEATVRERARDGLEALAPELPPPPLAGDVADWLLGQAAEPDAARIRELLLSDPAARTWAEAVAAPLRAVAGARVPELPGADLPEPRANGAGRPRPLRAEPAAAPAPWAPEPPEPPRAPTAPSPAPGRSSRLGGAILIGVIVLAVAAVLVYVLTRGDDYGPAAATATPPAATPAASATAVATGTPEPSANDIVLRGPAGSKAVGLMRLFRANDNTVRFALAAQTVPPNTGSQTYSIWFEKKSGAGLRLGVAQSPVTANGELTTAGPRNEDVAKFPQWFATYDRVLVTLDSAPDAKRHGTVILSGDLPHAAG